VYVYTIQHSKDLLEFFFFPLDVGHYAKLVNCCVILDILAHNIGSSPHLLCVQVKSLTCTSSLGFSLVYIFIL